MTREESDRLAAWSNEVAHKVIRKFIRQLLDAYPVDPFAPSRPGDFYMKHWLEAELVKTCWPARTRP